MMNCKNICEKYKADNTQMRLRYSLGQKRCTNCCIFIQCSGNRCPCCGAMLRKTARTKKSKEGLELI